MSNYYYFAATLPTLQFGAAPPMSSAEFLERCERSASGRELAALREAVLASPNDGAPAACLGISPFLDGYYSWERAFRAALARIRATRLGRPAPALPPQAGAEADSADTQARAAAQASSPLEGELAIERERWAVMQSLLGYDPFCFEALAAYRLRLQSLERLASFEAERGDQGYRGVYAAIFDAASAIDLTGDLR